MKHLQWILVLASALALAGSVEARGCGDMGMGSMGMGGMTGMCGSMMGPGAGDMMQGCPMMIIPFLEDLDLSEAQWDEIDQIMGDLEEQVEAVREEAGMSNPAAAFIQLFASPALTVSSIADFSDRAAALSEEIRTLHDESLVRIHDVLTSEQLAELSSYLPGDASDADADREGCGSGRMGGMGRMGGGCGRGMR
jgi:Spy/CpxP family protein refolding chaperone